jgi:hypothetical protein
LLRRVLGRAGADFSASSRCRGRGLRTVLLPLLSSVLTLTVECHSSQAFSRRVWLSGSRAGGTRQSSSPGRGPQAASQVSCSARTARRSRHRSSGLTQCGCAGVPPVTASSAAASRCADGETAGPAYRIVHASRIASSISRFVTLITRNHPSRPLHIRKPHAETSRKLVQGRHGSLCPVQVDHPYSGRSSVHRQSPCAIYALCLGSDEAGS